MADFKNLSEVLNYVKEATVIDLMSHVMSLDDEPFLKALVEPTEGLYLIGSIEPFIDKSKVYYPKAFHGDPAMQIKDFSKLAALKDDIVNANFETVITYRDLVLKSKYIKKEPTVPVTALKVAISIVEQYLTSISRFSKRKHPKYRLEYLIKQEYQYLVITDEYMHAFENLLDQVMAFVGDDHWNIYFTKIKGTNLIIEKAIDYRIFTFYQNHFASQEAEDE